MELTFVKVQGLELLKGFNAPSTSIKKEHEIITRLTKRISNQHVKFQGCKYPVKVIKNVLAALENEGFVTEGAMISINASPKIVVRRWGFPVDDATSAWLSPRNASTKLGEIELAEQAMELARISYMLSAGEDINFVYDHPTKP
ncbi:TPR domain protein [Diplocarpon mali]|nr:TPR domain protein [Diplocarpon mali]